LFDLQKLLHPALTTVVSGTAEHSAQSLQVGQRHLTFQVLSFRLQNLLHRAPYVGFAATIVSGVGRGLRATASVGNATEHSAQLLQVDQAHFFFQVFLFNLQYLLHPALATVISCIV